MANGALPRTKVGSAKPAGSTPTWDRTSRCSRSSRSGRRDRRRRREPVGRNERVRTVIGHSTLVRGQDTLRGKGATATRSPIRPIDRPDGSARHRDRTGDRPVAARTRSGARRRPRGAADGALLNVASLLVRMRLFTMRRIPTEPVNRSFFSSFGAETGLVARRRGLHRPDRRSGRSLRPDGSARTTIGPTIDRSRRGS